MNKYLYLYVIQGNYGYGWEDLSAYDKKETRYTQVKSDYQEYLISYPASYRIIERREKN